MSQMQINISELETEVMADFGDGEMTKDVTRYELIRYINGFDEKYVYECIRRKVICLMRFQNG